MGQKIGSKQLRDKILKGRGLTPTRPSKSVTRSLAHRPSTVPEELKTYAMKMMEFKFGEPIEIILMSGSLSIIERKYGIDTSTGCKWRKRLGLS